MKLHFHHTCSAVKVDLLVVPDLDSTASMGHLCHATGSALSPRELRLLPTQPRKHKVGKVGMLFWNTAQSSLTRGNVRRPATSRCMRTATDAVAKLVSWSYCRQPAHLLVGEDVAVTEVISCLSPI